MRKTQCQHTPGPWKVERGTLANAGRLFIEGTRRNMYKQHVATMGYAYDDDGNDLREQNADLIASAPTMFAALQELAAIGEGGVIERRETGKPTWSALDEVAKIARAAIAKAQGGAA